MTTPQTLRIQCGLAPSELWARVAQEVVHWVTQQNLPLRDTIVVLPFVQLLEPARRAFAAAGGWQPRVETSATLAVALAPPAPRAPGELSGSAVLDTLLMAQMLRALPALAAWERRDTRGHAQIVQATVTTAHDLYRAAAAQPPRLRADWWVAALRQIAPAMAAGSGPGGLEAQLCRAALEWARLAPAPATDALFGCQPAAWVVVQAGGADAVTSAVLQETSAATLLIDTDAPAGDPFSAAVDTGAPRCVATDGLEAEAHAAAAAVVEALNAGHAPVALITLDRVLTRRVRALLERQHVPLVDETGWALSTTRAAARVMALLRAARPGASADEWLEWLKGGQSALGQTAGLQRLEALWRAGRTPSPDSAQDRAATHLLADAAQQLVPLAMPGHHPLARWLQALATVLHSTSLGAALRGDAAGAQVLSALHCDVDTHADPAWATALQNEPLDRAGFSDWVDRTLEAASYLPKPGAGAEVVLTPLARAVLRPFGAVVIAGADERHLGAASSARGLLPETQARALGVDTAASRLLQEQLALVQLLRVPHVTFVHRRLDGDEPLARSAAIDAMALARQRAGCALVTDTAAGTLARRVDAAPVPRPAPTAVGALPLHLSASAVESLRTCPYQFFARSVLGLREAEELDDAIAKRDYGTWLHEVLHRFHSERVARNEPAAGDTAALNLAAEAAAASMGLDAASLLPYRAGFEQLVPAYLAWLHERDATGQRWADGERWAERTPPELGGVQLEGRIDRIDTQAGATEIIDYKTGGVPGLRAKVREPLEDTQLAFYALLMNADVADAPPVSACYLALDDSAAPVPVPHPGVADSARVLLHGLAEDLRRLNGGAGLPALGEGAACDYCKARGLCRRDHWAAASELGE